MTKTQQMSFFDAPVESVLDPEAMAQTLAQHPDFRVLRRLVPHSDYGPVNGQATRRVIVLDTETTGLDSKSESIIELAMLSVLVDAVTGAPVGPVSIYESFEDPGKPIPPQITEITGIDDSMVQGQRIDDAAVNALVQQADLVVAHNAGFDRPFVEARFPVFAGKAWGCSFQGIDWKKEGSGSAKLEFLASERGWFYDAHRAQVDCHALLQVLASPLADRACWRVQIRRATSCAPRVRLLRPKTSSRLGATVGTAKAGFGGAVWALTRCWTPNAPGCAPRSMASAAPGYNSKRWTAGCSIPADRAC